MIPTPPDIAALRALAEKATGGNWYVLLNKMHGFDCSVINPAGDAEMGNWLIAGVRWEANAAHIAANNPQATISLCHEIERLRASEAKMRAALEPFADIADLVKHTSIRDGVVVYRLNNPNGGYFELERKHFVAARAALATQGEK